MRQQRRAYRRTAMKRVVALILTLTLHAVKAVSNCERTGGPQSNEVICQPRALGYAFSLDGDSVIAAGPVTSLTIICESDDEESFLTNATLAGVSSLESLTLEKCRISTVPSVLGHLTQLRSLTLRTFNEDVNLVVESGALDRLRSLQKLDISHNMLQSLPSGLLCTLNGLQTLNISHNQLQDIEEIGMTGTSGDNSIGLPHSCRLSELSSLDLSHNRLSSLTRGALSGFPALRQLSVRHNQLQLVEESVLQPVPALRQLDLSGNQLETLPAELLQSTPRLTELRLADNRLSALTPAMFRRLRRLLVLDLSGNSIGSAWINSETFTALVRLVVLDLSHNRLNQIDTSVFAGLYSLQSLQLQHNRIDSISPDAFAALSNLHTLSLSHNKLQSIEEYSLNGLFVLNILALDHNIIDFVQQGAFSNISSLQELNLSHNQLTRVPEALQDIRQLKILNLGNNYINAIKGSQLAASDSIENLRLEGNVLTSITRDMMSAMPQVKILNLSRNRIRQVEIDAFKSSNVLEAIRLDANRLNRLDGLFSDLPQLRWLNLSDNRISRFDYSSVPRGLVWLDLHQNDISELENSDDIADQMPIRTLDVSFNRLTALSAKNLPKSTELLFLNDNLITSVEHYTFFLMSNLSRVDLFANQISHLDLNALRLNMPNGTQSMPKFYIGGNPFLCDCSLEWLQRYNRIDHLQHYPRVMDLESIYCRLIYNRERSYVPLVDADASMFLCPYERHCFTTCHCCDFDACDCEMTCPDKCSCYHDQSWSSNIIDCSNNGFTEIPSRLPMDATEVYLDGNVFKNLSGLTFLGRKNMKVLYLNNSKIEFIHNQTFVGLPQLETLHLESNLVTEFRGEEFIGLDRLRELYLENNQLKHVQNNTFTPLRQLEVLKLDGNRLTDFSVWQLHRNPYLVEIGLAGNAWSCACGYLRRFQTWLSTNVKKVSDVSSLQCWFEGDAQGRRLFGNNATCLADEARLSARGAASSALLPLLVASLAALCLLAALVGLALLYRRELRVWIYSRCGVRVCYRSALDEQQERLFDAFVSYSQRDAAFVQHVLAPKLEHGDMPYRLALHYRDFTHSAYLADTIVEAVESSRRTIMVLSKNFVENEWCRFQFKSAHHEVLKDRHKQLIVVLLGDISQRDLDPDLRLYLKTNTCISWDDKLFWDKLRFSMPDVKNNMRPLRSASHYSEIEEGKCLRRSPNTMESLWG